MILHTCMWIAVHPRLMMVQYDGVSGILTWPLFQDLCQRFPLQCDLVIFLHDLTIFCSPQNIGYWPSKCSNTSSILCSLSFIYSLLCILQNATLNVLKHLPSNSNIHGLNTNLQVVVFLYPDVRFWIRLCQ